VLGLRNLDFILNMQVDPTNSSGMRQPYQI